MIKYPYLNDKTFLKSFDDENFKEQFIRVTALDFSTEEPIAVIEGRSTSGSCNLNGTSNMRRTASCSIAAVDQILYPNEPTYANITEVENVISMNKKIRLETGFKNTLKDIYTEYSQYDVIWFPLGTFMIKSASVSSNNSGVNISLTLNDKCSLLNGDMGGIIPAATVFSEYDEYNEDNTLKGTVKIPIKQIIKNLVVEYGGELPHNVIINDVPDYIRSVMKWNGKEYIKIAEDDSGNKYLAIAEEVDSNKYSYGQDIGYTASAFVYPGTLECNAGESVASVLDNIRNVLGNYEWFYDIEGRFVFQKIKNYLNDSLTVDDIRNIAMNDYFSYANMGKSIYTFDSKNKHLISSISNAPQFQNIKNDFIVWGSQKGVSGADLPIKYHLAFAEKPLEYTNKDRLAIVSTDNRGVQKIIPVWVDGEKQNCSCVNSLEELPSAIPEKQLEWYFVNINSKETDKTVFKFNRQKRAFQSLSNAVLGYLTTTDWRTELYYQGIFNPQTYAQNPYFAELSTEWPKIWNARKEDVGAISSIPIYCGDYKDDFDITKGDYWLDFLEGRSIGETNFSDFSINNIGRRTKVVTSKDVNCLVSTPVPNYIYIEADGAVQDDYEAAKDLGMEVIQVLPDMYRNLALGGSQSSAFDTIKDLLITHTQYAESINLSVIPIYHLEPNTRITVHDDKTNIHGDYLIKSISLPLTTNGTSSISATKCIEKTY